MAWTFVRLPQNDGTEIGSLRSLGVEQFQVDPTISQNDQEMFAYLASPKQLAALNAGDGSVDVPNRSVTISGKTWTASVDKDRQAVQQVVAAYMAATGWTTNQATAVARTIRAEVMLILRERGLL